MASREHIFRSSFYWDSNLTTERKDEIIAWVKSLSNNNADKLKDLLCDVREDQQWTDESNSMDT